MTFLFAILAERFTVLIIKFGLVLEREFAERIAIRRIPGSYEDELTSG